MEKREVDWWSNESQEMCSGRGCFSFLSDFFKKYIPSYTRAFRVQIRGDFRLFREMLKAKIQKQKGGFVTI